MIEKLTFYFQKPKIFQYIYLFLFPKIYSTIDARGINLKDEFQLKFKSWNDCKLKKKKKIGKDVDNYEKTDKVNEFE